MYTSSLRKNERGTTMTICNYIRGTATGTVFCSHHCDTSCNHRRMHLIINTRMILKTFPPLISITCIGIVTNEAMGSFGFSVN